MGDLTRTLPKPMLPLGGVPLLGYTLYRLYRWGVTEAVVNVHYQPEPIRTYLDGFPHFPVHVSSEVPDILGTAGGIRHAIHHFGEQPFVLINPDALFFPVPHDGPQQLLAALKAARTEQSSLEQCAVLALAARPPGSSATGFAARSPVEDADRDSGLLRLRVSAQGAYYYIGYGLVTAAMFRHLPDLSFAELLPELEASAALGRLFGHVFRGRHRDVGTLETYAPFRQGVTGPLDVLGRSEEEHWEKFAADWPATVPSP